MPQSHRRPTTWPVRVPRSRPLRFPERCVGCDTSAPDGTVKLRESSFLSLHLAIPFAKGDRFTAEFPACADCAGRIRRRRLKRRMLVAAALPPAAVAALFAVRELGGRTTTWLALGVGVAIGILDGFAEDRWPPVVDISVGPRSAIITFRNTDYAFEFERLNPNSS